MNYDEYVDSKRIIVPSSGFEPGELNPKMFDYQRDITRWAIRRGKAALFQDCGLGKSFEEWEFAKQVTNYTDAPVLLVTPLSVGEQMAVEAPEFGYQVNLCRGKTGVRPGINITNYESLHKFDPVVFSGVILDESSILKGGSLGKMSNDLVAFAKEIPYRLCATATPSPNDLIELTFHAEFLGIMRESEIKALFFTQDGNSSNKFRLKRNAVDKFYQWLASWAVAMRKPSDLGYSDKGFELPELVVEQIVVDSADHFANGTLFQLEAHGIDEQRRALRNSIDERVATTADMVNGNSDQWLVWCQLNPESEAIAKAIPTAVEVSGNDKPEHKIDAMLGFLDGRYTNVVSKPSMWGFGMNFQHSNHMIFCGLGNSFERYYQAIKRQHRFGQKADRVFVYVVTTPADGAVVENIKRKWRQNNEMFDSLVKHMAIHVDLGVQIRHEMEYQPKQAVNVPSWLQTPVITPTEPGMWWIDLDSILYQIDGVIENYYQPVTVDAALIVPVWISTFVCPDIYLTEED